MVMAADLQQAGFLGYPQMSLLWQTPNALQSAAAGFAIAVNPVFDDNTPNDRPIGNWLILIDSLISQLPTGVLLEEQFNQVVDNIGRMCLAAFSALSDSLISNAQATAMLTAWNAAFGT